MKGGKYYRISWMPNEHLLESQTWIIPQLVPFSNIPSCIIFEVFLLSHLVNFVLICFDFFFLCVWMQHFHMGSNIKQAASTFQKPSGILVKTIGEGFCTIDWGSFPQTIRKSSGRDTEGVCGSSKISQILSLDLVSIFFSILNSCNALKVSLLRSRSGCVSEMRGAITVCSWQMSF